MKSLMLYIMYRLLFLKAQSGSSGLQWEFDHHFFTFSISSHQNLHSKLNQWIGDVPNLPMFFPQTHRRFKRWGGVALQVCDGGR